MKARDKKRVIGRRRSLDLPSTAMLSTHEKRLHSASEDDEDEAVSKVFYNVRELNTLPILPTMPTDCTLSIMPCYAMQCPFHYAMLLCYAMLCYAYPSTHYSIMSCHVMSYHIVPCNVISCHIISCHIMSYAIM